MHAARTLCAKILSSRSSTGTLERSIGMRSERGRGERERGEKESERDQRRGRENSWFRVWKVTVENPVMRLLGVRAMTMLHKYFARDDRWWKESEQKAPFGPETGLIGERPRGLALPPRRRGMAPGVLPRIFPPICFSDRLFAMQLFRASQSQHRRSVAVHAWRSDGAKFPGYAMMYVKMNGNTYRAAQSLWLTMALLWAVNSRIPYLPWSSGGNVTLPICRIEGA